MMSQTRRRFIVSGLAAGGVLSSASAHGANSSLVAEQVTEVRRNNGDRDVWLEMLERVATPVLEALSRGSLRREMPVEAVAGHEEDRATGTHLEAVARLLAGLASWLELEATPGESARETALRSKYRGWCGEGLGRCLTPGAEDYLRFGDSAQTLVDSSFLSLALLRAPKHLLGTMDTATRERLVKALESERKVQPPFNNWLLFAAMNEAMLRRLGGTWDRLRVDYALREHQAWYMGDGTYGDGPQFHADFYNSYVIHPYLLALMDEVGDDAAWNGMKAAIHARARRYAAIQERVIGPGGEFPVLGRSLTYRAGAFHLLADIAKRGMLPEGVAPAAVRCALTAVQRRTLWAAGTFSKAGWLQIGLAGHQPSLGETYISTGSLYLCSVAWLPLGLPPGDIFWATPPEDWTQKRVWAGMDATADHALGG